jgi:hypothetical protein
VVADMMATIAKGEIQAMKVEVTEALARRIKDDTRDNAVVFGIASTVIGEVLADIIFAAAKDEKHAKNLLDIVNAMIFCRWRQLASKESGT